jgi:purine-nucleoside phosphorylase
VNPDIHTCDIMILKDHINLLCGNPLRGKNYKELGPRFPDMSRPYHQAYIDKALEIADRLHIRVHLGVYAAVQGPNLETKAEYAYLRIIGADVVGMSTVPEVIVANHMDLPVFAVSVITDEGFHEVLEPVSIEDVIRAANKAEPQMTKIIKELIMSL